MGKQTRPSPSATKSSELRSAFNEERYARLVERLRDIRETVASHRTFTPRSPDDAYAK